jgi:hypothetical protein
MNPLNDYPRARRIAYQVFWTVSLAIGGTHIGFQSADVATPMWLTVALSVLPFVGAGIGYTAQANVNEYDPKHDGPDKRGYGSGV